MRLIDADTLITNMDKGIQGTAREYLKFYQMAVEDELTSVDLDSVIKQLEKKRDECYLEMAKEEKKTDYFSQHIYEEYYNQGIAYEKALEIIKSGVNI